jgi:hypothetical protein
VEGDAAAAATTGAELYADWHHILPRQILRQLQEQFGQDEFPTSEFDETVPVPRELHTDMHRGIGQGKGGAYNNWWRVKLTQAVESGRPITGPLVKEWMREISNEMGLRDR